MDIKPLLDHLWTWRKHSVWGWGEAMGLTLVTLLFCYYINPTNPLFVKGVFPWPWIASVIVVFQYGFGPSLLTIGIISMAAIFQRNVGAISTTDFQSYLLSGVTLVLVCALFSSGWARRMINAEVLQAYNDERLKSLSRSHYMLRVSSDYLEQNIITKPMTLRLALKELHELNLKEEAKLSRDVAYSFLQILAQFCSVNVAGIYLYQNKKLSTDPFVEIGLMGSLATNDLLIKKSIGSDEICYVSINQIEDVSDCAYLIVIPLISSEEEQLGLLAIKDMPFWSLNEEIIRVLSILVYYFTKEVVVGSDIANFLRIYPDCSVDFAKQLTKLAPLKRDMSIDSALVAVMVSKKLRQHSVIYNLENQNRFLDSYWSLESGDYDVLITLMPFTFSAGVHGYITRISDYLRSDLGLSFEKEQIKTRSMQLDGSDPVSMIRYFLNFIEEKNIA